MNTDDLKPLWEAYKNEVGSSMKWSEKELLQLIKPAAVAYPWYQSYRHAILNVGVSVLLLGITSGC
ncbi:hypothetical protein [Larkinella rosea]|uniref:Uncharacterized protein n=1 Tax=Larkinella rosea TaxID=2025312 RepID=A0A3P1BH09_9BACT|nr:hypothetical protein [Larkinella rosea]RRA99853.1 hypothetical protein EHT25_24790 [Larkinella rosea]